MGIQALAAELAIEGFDEGVVGRFAWPGEGERDVTLISPEAEIAGDELAALIDADGLREANLAADVA